MTIFFFVAFLSCVVFGESLHVTARSPDTYLSPAVQERILQRSGLVTTSVGARMHVASIDGVGMNYSQLDPRCVAQPIEFADGLACISNILRKHLGHVSWWVTLGSALAVSRDEGNAMPWDHDVDVSIFNPPRGDVPWQVAQVFNMSNMKEYEKEFSFCGKSTKLEPDVALPENISGLSPPLSVSRQSGIPRCATVNGQVYCWKRTSVLSDVNYFAGCAVLSDVNLPYINHWFVNDLPIDAWHSSYRGLQNSSVELFYYWNIQASDLWPLKICNLCAHHHCAEVYCPQNMTQVAVALNELYPNSSKPDLNVCTGSERKWIFSESHWQQYLHGDVQKYISTLE